MDNFNDTNYGKIPTRGGQLCPFCDGWEITLTVMNLAKVKPDEPFKCEECGRVLRYTVIKQFPHDQIILHRIKKKPFDIR